MRKAKSLIRLARPQHYIKNGLVFVPVFFAHRLHDPEAILAVGAGFVGFCLAASFVYAFNDIVDIDTDAVHPLRQKRPLAAGEITVLDAEIFMLILAGLALIFGLCLLNAAYFFVVTAYVVVNILYTLKLKRMPGVDVICVAAGFVLRIFV